MATMPGLPMFGHGQIEGFAEKYGMEYRRAYVDETPDQGLVERHEREIFPLLHQRAALRRGRRLPALRLRHRRRRGQRGRLRLLEPARRRAVAGRLPQPVRRDERLDQERRRSPVARSPTALGLSGGGRRLPRDARRSHRARLPALARELAEKGLYLELRAYEYHVLRGAARRPRRRTALAAGSPRSSAVGECRRSTTRCATSSWPRSTTRCAATIARRAVREAAALLGVTAPSSR